MESNEKKVKKNQWTISLGENCSYPVMNIERKGIVFTIDGHTWSGEIIRIMKLFIDTESLRCHLYELTTPFYADMIIDHIRDNKPMKKFKVRLGSY